MVKRVWQETGESVADLLESCESCLEPLEDATDYKWAAEILAVAISALTEAIDQLDVRLAALEHKEE